MRGNPFVLTPRWIMFDQFWIALRTRNGWLIQLRFAAAAMLALIIPASLLLPGIRINIPAVGCLAGVILLYNLVLRSTLKHIPPTRAPFHGLHFALIQICLDLAVLALLVHYTGGVESPVIFFFIFHVIIGSLILPASSVSMICAGIIIIMFTGALLEAHGTIPHHAIAGLFAAPVYTNSTYIAIHFIVFSITVFVSSFLANSISKELYLRERSLTIAYRKLEEAERAKSRYVMSVVHDLKTPIAAVITYLNLILEGDFGAVHEEQERPLERSRIRLNGAITLINDILQLSHVKLAASIEAVPVNLVTLFDEIYQEMRILFQAKHIRYSLWNNGTDDLTLEAEPRLLRLALGNLISNAHKYTEEGGAVEVHLKQVDGAVTIEVADSGIGIPETELGRIFEDFYRSSVSKKKGIEGTGLGLSIVHQIVRQLHGTIRVESPSRLQLDDTRRGTAFFITLPKAYTALPEEIDDDELAPAS
jgi:signal transduction histidine kinase